MARNGCTCCSFSMDLVALLNAKVSSNWQGVDLNCLCSLPLCKIETIHVDHGIYKCLWGSITQCHSSSSSSSVNTSACLFLDPTPTLFILASNVPLKSLSVKKPREGCQSPQVTHQSKAVAVKHIWDKFTAVLLHF